MRKTIELHLPWIYLGAIVLGLAAGYNFPLAAPAFEALLWPVLAALLYATFTQVPLTHLRNAFRDRRFMAALLIGNFLVLPLLVWLLSGLLPADPAIQLGALLVLLVPCTDWYVSFTHLGKGDAARATAAVPVILLVQFLALPAYLWFFFGPTLIDVAVGGHLLSAFAGLIMLPLLLAWLTERFADRSRRGKALVRGLGRLPVPLLALVVFVIAASQVTMVVGMMSVLWQVLLVFLSFLLAAAYLGKLLGRLFRLRPPVARTLAFSFGTRNSFVVLPLALALPDAWQAAAVVIVFQSLVELSGMMAYLAWVPRRLIPDAAPA